MIFAILASFAAEERHMITGRARRQKKKKPLEVVSRAVRRR
jgi:DNA invertase Pin-like site-specific DNA recombinase